MKKFTPFLFFQLFFSITFGQTEETVIQANDPVVNADCCNPPKVVINIPVSNAIIFNLNNTLTLSQPIFINASGGRKVVSIKAELNYFEFTPGSEDCLTCNKNSATFGNFSAGSFASVAATGAGTHVMTSNFSTPRPPGNFPASLTITLPPLVKCCDGVVRWCVRYVITLDDCTVCSKVICYAKKKQGATAVVLPQPNNLN